MESMKAKTQKGKTSRSKSPAEEDAGVQSESASAGSVKTVKSAVQKVSRAPVKKTGEKKAVSDGAAKGLFSRSMQFLREAKGELKKVKWPTKKELLASTAVVIVLSLLVAFYLGLIDFILIKIIRLIVG